VEQDRSVAEGGGVRRFEVLIPRRRRPGLLAALQCAASGAPCEVQTRRERLIQMTVVTVSGLGAVVEQTEARLLDRRRRFPSGG
jgi:hypothetical protein